MGNLVQIKRFFDKRLLFVFLAVFSFGVSLAVVFPNSICDVTDGVPTTSSSIAEK